MAGGKVILVGLMLAGLAACSGEPAETNNVAEAPVENVVDNMAMMNAAAPAANASDDAAANATAAADAKKAEEETAAKEKAEADAKAKADAGSKAKAEAAKKVADATPPASFARCTVCHDATSARQNKIGPELYGAFGKAAGTHAPSYNYSDALKNSGLKWDEATLDKWIENPRALVPGNRMSFPGLKDAAKRQEIIAYLKAQSGK